MNDTGNNSSIEKMMNDVEKHMEELPNSSGAILVKIFSKFLIMMNFNPMRYVRYMQSYVHRVSSGKTILRPDLSSIRGNMTKLLSKKSFTWENFIKAMIFLQVKHIKITVEITDMSNRKYEASEEMNFDHSMINDLKDEDDGK